MTTATLSPKNWARATRPMLVSLRDNCDDRQLISYLNQAIARIDLILNDGKRKIVP